MHVLVTGAGLVGTSVALTAGARHRTALLDVAANHRYLRERMGSDVQLLSCDITNLGPMAELIAQDPPDAIVHSAGLIGEKMAAAPHLAVEVNVAGTVAVLEAARYAGVRRVVVVGSLAVYDWGQLPPGIPVGEDAPRAPRSLYGGSKLAAEELALTYGRRGELDISVVRLAGVYGPGHYRGGSQVGALIDRTVSRAAEGKPVRVPVQLGCREYLHADDAARAIWLDLLTPLEGTRVCNVGTGEVHTRARFGAELRAALDLPAQALLPVPDEPADTPPLDIGRAAELIGYRPSVSLSEGLRALGAARRPEPAGEAR
jgi:nucleoside-diphosphate-sugar epimerase